MANEQTRELHRGEKAECVLDGVGMTISEKINELLRRAHSEANDILFCIGNDKSLAKDKRARKVKKYITQALALRENRDER